MRSKTMAVLLTIVAVLSVTSAVAASGAGGIVGPAFYVDGDLYKTVLTPTDISGTKAPAHTFDAIYVIVASDEAGVPISAFPVAEAAPGDRDYNGGRWQAHPVSIADYAAAIAAFDANGSGDFDSAEEVEAAIASGAGVDLGVAASFVCPVIKL